MLVTTFFSLLIQNPAILSKLTPRFFPSKVETSIHMIFMISQEKKTDGSQFPFQSIKCKLYQEYSAFSQGYHG
jgi:hypothetical protein